MFVLDNIREYYMSAICMCVVTTISCNEQKHYIEPLYLAFGISIHAVVGIAQRLRYLDTIST